MFGGRLLDSTSRFFVGNWSGSAADRAAARAAGRRRALSGGAPAADGGVVVSDGLGDRRRELLRSLESSSGSWSESGSGSWAR